MDRKELLLQESLLRLADNVFFNNFQGYLEELLQTVATDSMNGLDFSSETIAFNKGKYQILRQVLDLIENTKHDEGE